MNKTNKIFLFDLDGVLTEPRKNIAEDMAEELCALMKGKEWAIVSGSDEPLVRAQLKRWFDEWVIYCCNGTQKFDQGKNTYQVSMRDEMGKAEFGRLITTLIEHLETFKDNIPLESLTGNHILNRGSMVNFSFIGRGELDFTARKQFVEIDKSCLIRDGVKRKLHELFPDLAITFGGETSIDITPKGWDKQYIMKHYPDHEIVFFGDALFEGGNDYPMLSTPAKCIQVNGPDDFLAKLKEEIEND